MRKFISLLALSVLLSSCQESATSPTIEGSDEFVTLAPRLLRTASVPMPLFNGTDRVRVRVTSSNSSFTFDQTVSFVDHSLDVPGVPRSATVQISLSGLDADGNVIWSGSSATFLASTSETSNFDIPLSAPSNQTSYLIASTWQWQGWSSSDTGVEWLNLNDDGTYDRLYVRWIDNGIASTRDTFFGVYESGAYLQTGDSLRFAVDEAKECGYRGTLKNECGVKGPNWVTASNSAFAWSWSMGTGGILSLSTYPYRPTGGIHLNQVPPSLAPSTWERDTLSLVDATSQHMELSILADGTFKVNLSQLDLVSQGTSAAVTTGTWTGNADSLKVVALSQSVCFASSALVDCTQPANFVTSTISDTTTYVWAADGTSLLLFDAAESSYEMWTLK